MVIHFYNNEVVKEALMKFIDLWDDEYISLRSPFVTRMFDFPSKKLCDLSDKYQDLNKRKNELEDRYPIICMLTDGTYLERETYSREEMKALQEYFSITRMMDNYERLEIYKLGYHDCIIWLQMIGQYDH